MKCSKCPCPDKCDGWQSFCEWAAREPQDPVQMRHICNRGLTGQSTSYPSVGQQAKNLFRSALGFARSGFKLAPRAVRRARLAICEGCEHYDLVARRCRKCGCRQSAKVWVAADKCPLLPPKWGPVEEKKAS
jgi:hypothetical protein